MSQDRGRSPVAEAIHHLRGRQAARGNSPRVQPVNNWHHLQRLPCRKLLHPDASHTVVATV